MAANALSNSNRSDCKLTEALELATFLVENGADVNTVGHVGGVGWQPEYPSLVGCAGRV
jgi:hypothetical protein